MVTIDAGNGRPYERLKAWQACHELVLAVYRATARWPKEEVFGLTSEVRSAAHSSALNICRGSTTKSAREYRSYLQLTLSALAALAYDLQLAGDLGYIPREQLGEIEVLRDHASKLTWGLHRAIARAAKDLKER
jgi:four helix bundle protein